MQPHMDEDPQWLTALPSAQHGMLQEAPAKHAVPSWQPATAALDTDKTPLPVGPTNIELPYDV